MSTADALDCLLLGHYAPDASAAWQAARAAQKHSGTYAYVKSNSVLVDGRRLSYGELLNLVLARASNVPSSLHVANLPHLGCCYLKSFLARRGFRAGIVNFVNQDLEALEEGLRAGPLVVAITTTLYTDNHPCKELVALVRERSPRSLIVVGGPHVFNVCSEYGIDIQDALVSEMGADCYIFDSQGEAALARLLAALRDGQRDLSAIPNLVLRDGPRGWRRTRREPENNDLDAEPVDWRNVGLPLASRSAQVRTARSCSFGCTVRYRLLPGAW